MSPTARLNGVSYESEESRRYDKENLLWQFTVATMSDPAVPIYSIVPVKIVALDQIGGVWSFLVVKVEQALSRKFVT